MKKIRIIYVSLIVLLLCIWAFQISSERSALETAESWANVAPIKSCDSEPTIENVGSAFTREFFIEFTCNREALENWVANSSGLQTASITKSKNETEVYSISAGSGASFAQVEINWLTNTVKLRAYWS